MQPFSALNRPVRDQNGSALAYALAAIAILTTLALNWAELTVYLTKQVQRNSAQDIYNQLGQNVQIHSADIAATLNSAKVFNQ